MKANRYGTHAVFAYHKRLRSGLRICGGEEPDAACLVSLRRIESRERALLLYVPFDGTGTLIPILTLPT
jgi:hypothetical protein